MRKMPCLYVRDFSVRPFLLTPVLTPGCEWVFLGQAKPFRKRDGTAVLWREGRLFKRYDVKRGKAVPAGAIACDETADEVTGHWPHWIEVGEEPESRWHREARNASGVLPDGTYELCGPKFSANPERLETHVFIKHDSEFLSDAPLGGLDPFAALRAYLETFPGEGIVYHRAGPFVEMCKIRRDDFGFKWPIPASAAP